MSTDTFVTEERFERSLARLALKTPQNLAALRSWYVGPGDAQAVQFFFHTNAPSKAESLAALLQARGFQARARAEESPLRWEPQWLERASWIVSGVTPPLPMTEAFMADWAEEMCRSGREHDCEFNGWTVRTPDFLEMNDDYCLQGSQDGTRKLTIYRWNAASEAALVNNDVDWVSPGAGLGSLKVLEPHAARIVGLSGPSDALSLEGIEAFPFLERLYLSSTPAAHGDYRRLPRLREFRCLAADTLDPRLLDNPALRELGLHGARKLKTLQALSACVGLESATLRGAPLKTLEGVAHWPALRELRLINCRSMEDIGELSQSARLQILEIFKAPKLQDVAPIAALPALRWITLIDAPATLHGHAVLDHWPALQSATLLLRTEPVAFDAVARHQSLAEATFYTHEGFALPVEADLRRALQVHGKTVRSVMLRPADKFPSVQVTFESPYWRLGGLPAGYARRVVN